jgi:hypothetical protein
MPQQAINYNLRKYFNLTDIPMGPKSKTYLVDPVNGSDSNPGTNLEQPLLTLAAAEDLCVSGQNDAVLLEGCGTANNLTANLAWDKSYTHLIGLTGNLPGVGQRARITSAATAAITEMLTLSGSGCIFRNLNIQNECSADADSGAMTISGMRNELTNCFISGMLHATPAARAAAYSLTLSGPENFFNRCAIGVQTINRSAANAELIIDGSNVKRNHFVKCQFLSQSVTAGKVLVRIKSTAIVWSQIFEDCAWLNWSSAAGESGASINHAIEDGQTGFHQNVFLGSTIAVGCTQFVDVATFSWTPGAACGGAVAPIALNNLTT